MGINGFFFEIQKRNIEFNSFPKIKCLELLGILVNWKMVPDSILLVWIKLMDILESR